MKLIILNGPPRAGKDTLADALAKTIKNRDVIFFSIKHILCLDVAKRYNLSPLAVWQINADTNIKDDPLEIFGGKSVRQALIYESEEVIKKEYGEQGVVIKALNDLKTTYGDALDNAIVVCADGGFNSEVPMYGEILHCPPEDVTIVRITKEGRTFQGDSREFIDNPKYIFKNDGTIDEFINYAVPTLISGCGLNSEVDITTGIKYRKEHLAFLHTAIE